jgi:hypothetical protein
MKKSLILTVAGAVAMVTLGSTAYAENTIDKGELGKYVRQGRFVKPVLTASPRGDSNTNSHMASVDIGTRPIIDKGDLGKYERHGRTLRAVREVEPTNRTAAEAVSPAGGVKHEHGLNGKEHKNSSN